MTAAALAHILRDVRDHGIPDAFSTSTQRRHRQNIVYTNTAFGPLIQNVIVTTKSGKRLTLPVQHPLAMLVVAANESEAFAVLIHATLDACDDRISIIVYSDEVTPGQVLQGLHDRKVQAMYWSLLNFGFPTLTNEAAWFTLLSWRSSQVEQLEGSMSHVYKVGLRFFFGTPSGHDLRQGVVLELRGRSRLVFGDLRMMLHDERALKDVSQCKGATGVKLCVECQNVASFRSVVLPDPTGFLIPSTSLEVERFLLHTDATITGIVRRLQEVARTDHGALARLEYEFGFNHCDENMLLDPHLNINLMSVIVWDWMHCFFISGVFNKELKALMDRLKHFNLGWTQLDAYLQKWCWPKAYASAAQVCAAAEATTDDDHEASGNASQFVSLAPVFAKYLEDVVVPSGACPTEVASMLLLCDVVELLQHVQSGLVRPHDLEQAILRHLRKHQEAYGFSLWIPKMHFTLHLAPALARHGLLPNTFVHERKHRMVKKVCNPRLNTTAFEHGVLEEITLQHLYDLRDLLVGVTLRDERDAPKKMRSALVELLGLCADDVVRTARIACVRARAISMGDVALFTDGDGNSGAAEVYFHASVNGTLYTCVSPWGFVSTTSHVARYRVRDAPRLVRTSCLLESVIYSRVETGHISQLCLPLRHR